MQHSAVVPPHGPDGGGDEVVGRGGAVMIVPLRDTMRELGERMSPARLPEDLWRRGRRQRYRGRIVAVVTGALLCAAVAVVSGLHVEPQPAEGGPVVPRSVGLSYFWQATFDMAPPGPASVLFGGDSLGLSSGDPFEEEGGKLAVLGLDPRPRRRPAAGGLGRLHLGQFDGGAADRRRVPVPV
jgi:hypothetical protein